MKTGKMPGQGKNIIQNEYQNGHKSRPRYYFFAKKINSFGLNRLHFYQEKLHNHLSSETNVQKKMERGIQAVKKAGSHDLPSGIRARKLKNLNLSAIHTNRLKIYQTVVDKLEMAR